jgi:integrase
MGVYKKRNRWYVDYYLPGGKRKREVVKIRGIDPSKITLRDAEKALSIRKAEIAEGKFNILRTDKPISFEKLMDEYLKWAKENHKSPERDRAAAKPLLSYFQGKNINSLSLWHVEKYKSTRKAQGRKSETINKELGVLRRMFNLALTGVLKTKISKNPISGLRLLKVTKFKPRVLKDSEFQKLFSVASPHFKRILLCAYMTGMRRSEIARLKWENVDLEECYIHVTETKNNEARSIPISKGLFDTLEELKEKSDSDFVFTTHEGKPYTHLTAWKRAWSTALRKSGVGKCRFHDLRHTFVSNLIVGEKEDVATVMELSGHKDMSMLKRYSHTREDAKKAAIQKLGVRLENFDTSRLPVLNKSNLMNS